MDGSTFDRLTRFFGTRRTRRTLAGTLIGAGAGLLGLAGAEAAPCPKRKKRCKKRCIPRRQCCTNANCRPKGSGKVCRRGRCVCPPSRKRCRNRCLPKAACCGGCPAGLVCKQATCCVGTSEALTAALGPGGPATIPLCPGTTYHGSFTVARNVTVLGAGATSSILDGGGLARVVSVDDDVTARLHDVQISNGQAPESDAGGGVRNLGTLTLLRCLVTGNQAASGGGIFNGGVAATLTLESTAVTNNVASEADGGGVNNSGGLLILQGTGQVAGNRAQSRGGGIYNAGSTARVALQDATVVTDNDADPANLTSGGGIFNNPLAPGTVTFSGTAQVIGNRPNDCTPTATCPS